MILSKWKFQYKQELNEMFSGGSNLDWSKAIVDHCIYLAKSEEPFKGEKLIMEILVEEENTIIDIALRSDDLIPTLATSLPVLEEAEEYEYCQKIVDTINLLSN